MLLTTVIMTSIIDVTGVLGMPLKLVAIKSFKSNNRKIMSKQQKSSKTIFQGATFLGEVFPVGNFPGPYFCGVIFRGQFSGHRGSIILSSFLVNFIK